ncbi:NnrS family protein [Vibrio sp. SS-MA-C1-2]|uniref:NnrS family protein n=1 Tax=Vibrio sp. SS-MA-C1-2 TaxID=2908646 RepID=UPI001F3234B9|nr:NnrS family protein [Vibrio sp. SS-MA-C1-2]UJF17314.1 NnrS family protein [Vibrio sp. SS-MA-C1-2]
MMQITDTAKEQAITPIFRLAFRPLFLFSGIFSSLAILFWTLYLNGNIAYTPANNPIWWHSHEMIFGFILAIILGFLLTAIQTWTGIPGVRGKKLALIALLWLAARVLNFIVPPNLLTMAVDISWLIIAIYFVARPIILRRQWKNLFFTPVILLFIVFDIVSFYSASQFNMLLLEKINTMAILLISIVVLIVGGRVIPFFTSRGTQTTPIIRHIWLEVSALVTAWLSLLFTGLALFVFDLPMTNSLLAISYAAVAMTNFVRLATWRSHLTIKVPLLWSLHLSYLSMIAGFVLLAINSINGDIGLSISLHMLSVGGIGGIILAMIARVSLGHTGRKLEIKPIIAFAFSTIFIAVIFRTVAILLWPNSAALFITIAGLAWFIGFGIWSIVYFSILSKPRIDGHPG